MEREANRKEREGELVSVAQRSATNATQIKIARRALTKGSNRFGKSFSPRPFGGSSDGSPTSSPRSDFGTPFGSPASSMPFASSIKEIGFDSDEDEKRQARIKAKTSKNNKSQTPFGVNGDTEVDELTIERSPARQASFKMKKLSETKRDNVNSFVSKLRITRSSAGAGEGSGSDSSSPSSSKSSNSNTQPNTNTQNTTHNGGTIKPSF
jgi:hypothetical protein